MCKITATGYKVQLHLFHTTVSSVYNMPQSAWHVDKKVPKSCLSCWKIVWWTQTLIVSSLSSVWTQLTRQVCLKPDLANQGKLASPGTFSISYGMSRWLCPSVKSRLQVEPASRSQQCMQHLQVSPTSVVVAETCSYKGQIRGPKVLHSHAETPFIACLQLETCTPGCHEL